MTFFQRAVVSGPYHRVCSSMRREVSGVAIVVRLLTHVSKTMLVAKAIGIKRDLQKDIVYDLASCEKQAVDVVCVLKHAHALKSASSSLFAMRS